MTTRRVIDASRHHQVDRVADRLDVLDRVAVELDAELVLDDLRELDEVERVDVEALEGRFAGDLGPRRRSRRGRRRSSVSTALVGYCVGIWFSLSLVAGVQCSGAQAAVDGEDGAGHVAGLVGGEEAHAGGDLLRRPGPAGRDRVERCRS